LFGRHIGIEDNRHLNVCADLFQELFDKGGFSGADFSGQHDKSDPVREAILKIGEGSTVLVSQIKKARIRDDMKWLFLKSVKFFVHDNQIPRPLKNVQLNR